MVFYITTLNSRSHIGIGISGKVTAQVEAMKAELGAIYYTVLTYPKAYLMDGKKIVEERVAVSRNDYVKVLIEWMKKYHVTATYIRYVRSTKSFLDFLKYQKENGIKTVLEIPSYPYDQETPDGIMKKTDQCYRKELYKYVSRLSTYSSDEQIWGISCIKLKNGINIQQVPIHGKKKEKEKIVLISISTLRTWHGYERILEGMYQYYKADGVYDFRLKIIGSGPEEVYYRELVDRYGLYDHVEFLGLIKTDEKERLNKEFDASDIALGSLGMYKAGYEEGSPIKCAEYCARGIPFIYGYYDLRFPQDWDFMLRVSNDSKPIDMNQVIDFYENVTSKKNYKKIIRKYAEDYLTWDNIMQPVVEYLQAD